MTTKIAWEVMYKVVLPRASSLGHVNAITIQSRMDWRDGVALNTKDGYIHVLGTGEIVDEDDVLKWKYSNV